MPVRKPLWLALIPLAITGVLIGQCRREDPSTVAKKVTKAFEERNWKALYEMSSAHERKILSWNANAFNTVMEHISQQGSLPVRRFQSDGPAVESTSAVYRLFFEKSTVSKSFAVTLRLDVDKKWKLDIGDLPYLYIRTLDADWATRFRHLADGMSKANITQLYSQLKNQVLTIKDVNEAAARGSGVASWHPYHF